MAPRAPPARPLAAARRSKLNTVLVAAVPGTIRDSSVGVFAVRYVSGPRVCARVCARKGMNALELRPAQSLSLFENPRPELRDAL